MAIDDSVRLDTRLAGQVRRYHTWPILGEQTIGEHCWQLMRIYLCVVDRIDSRMVYHIMLHDIGEHSTGDIPYPVKRDNPILKEQIDFLERKSQAAQVEYWNSFRQVFLSDEDKALFKQIELVEMAEFGLDQMNLGNHHGYIIANRCLEAVYKNQPCAKLAQYVIKRLQLFFDQCHPINSEYDEGEWWSAQGWEELYANGKLEPSGRNPLQDKL